MGPVALRALASARSAIERFDARSSHHASRGGATSCTAPSHSAVPFVTARGPLEARILTGQRERFSIVSNNQEEELVQSLLKHFAYLLSDQVVFPTYIGEKVMSQMTNVRRTYSTAEELALTTQVDGRCPLCGEALFYPKKAKYFKGYELAHIYPLNPSAKESVELKDLPRLHSDVNHPDNLIPLCVQCHTKFDRPRTTEEYIQLVAKKQQCLRKAAQQELHAQYPLEAEVQRVVQRLHSTGVVDDLSLEYNPKPLHDKFDSTLPIPTRQKIKHAVADYYQYVRQEFLEMERENPTVSQLISS